MLRASRLLLVASAAASIGVVVFIESRARGFAPIVLLFPVAAVLFVVAARDLENDPRRGKLLAAAAALTLAGMATLAGFGAGEVTFPASGLGVIAAWLAVMWRAPRWVGWALLAYIGVGIALSLPRLGALVFLPWLLPSLLTWPISTALFLSAGAIVGIYAVLGLAVALAISAYVRPAVFTPRPAARTLLRDGVMAGLALVLLEALFALTQVNTSARYELVPFAIAVMFLSAAMLVGGVRLLRAGVFGGALAAAVGGALVLYIVTARPTVECSFRGVATTAGPWWLPYFGSMTSTGGGSAGPSRAPQTATGTIARDDGVVIRYTCVADALVQFEIQR